MIKYRYALDSNRNRIDVFNLEHSKLTKEDKFYSIDFNQELIPKLGKIRTQHFSHKSKTDKKGNAETYLHALGKKVFFEEYSKCLNNNSSYYIEYYNYKYCNRLQKKYNIICELGPEKKIFDLAEYYDEIIIEKKNDEFIPDLLIRNSKTKKHIYIEIAVTHNSSDKKLNSKNRIIEFSIKKEEDIQEIIDFGKNGNSQNAQFFNFKDKKEIGEFCSKGNCSKKINLFSVEENGKCELLIINENEIYSSIKKIKSNYKWLIIELYNNKYFEELHSIEKIHNDLFLQYIAKAYKKKKSVKNCYICRYHAQNPKWEYQMERHIFCKFLKIACHFDKAINCKYYKIEETYINEYLEPLYTY